jgi:hypothetical protein
MLVERADNFQIDSLRVEGQLLGADSRGLDFQDCFNVRIERCSLYAALGTGVSISGGSDLVASYVTVMNASAYGFSIENSPRVSFAYCRALGQPARGLRVLNSRGASFQNCLMSGTMSEAAYFESCDSLTIFSLMTAGNSDRAVSLVRSHDCSVLQLSIQSRPILGLLLDRSTNCRVDSLQVVNFDQDTAVAVRLDSAEGSVFRRCMIYGNCGTAIAINQSPGVTFTHTRMIVNVVAAGIALSRSPNVAIQTCSLTCNVGTAGILLTDGCNDDTLMELTILGNTRYGIMARDSLGPSSQNLVIANSYIRSWTASGIFLDHVQSPQLYYNTIVGLELPGVSGVRLQEITNADARDNIIWNKGLDSSSCYRIDGTYPFRPGGTDYNDLYASGIGGSIAQLNDIFYPSLSDWRGYSSAPDLQSLSQDPRFVTGNNFHLLAESSCRDSGIPIPELIQDLDGDLRDPVTPDIGADEHQVGSITETECVSVQPSLMLYYNPTRTHSLIEYTLPWEETVWLRLFDILGRSVLTYAPVRQKAGRHQTVIDVSKLPSGVYLLDLQAGELTATLKLVRN